MPVEDHDSTRTVEEQLMSAGPRAVAAHVTHGVATGDGSVDVRDLGQLCARKARNTETYADALAWSDAAVLCYREAAKTLPAGYVRHGAELIQYGVMLAMVHRYGSTSPELQNYLNTTLAWCDAQRRGFVDAAAFRAAQRRFEEPAMLLQESLALLQALWRMDLLAPDLDAWFIAAGLTRAPAPAPSAASAPPPPRPREAAASEPPAFTIHQASLRPSVPPSEPPIAAVLVGELAIAAIASNWGDWAGTDAEQPAVRTAVAVLEAAARDPSPDWPAALTRAFAAAPSAIDPFARPDPIFHDPITSLTCAVVTHDAVHLAWVGTTVACLLADGRVIKTTEPLTIREAHRRSGRMEALARIPAHLHDKVDGTLGPSSQDNPAPELAVWPRLQPEQSLLLTSLGMQRILQARLPLPAASTGAAWLHAALAIDLDILDGNGFPEFGDRIGASITPA